MATTEGNSSGGSIMNNGHGQHARLSCSTSPQSAVKTAQQRLKQVSDHRALVQGYHDLCRHAGVGRDFLGYQVVDGHFNLPDAGGLLSSFVNDLIS